MDWENRYTAYFELCKEASKNDVLFADFKRHQDCRNMLEHVSYETGLEYLKQIKQHFPYLLDSIKFFCDNDIIGNPFTHYYSELELEISPSNLRYIKVLGDLINLCGSLDGKDIVEIGVGYGGQCKIVHDLFKPKSYTLVDHPSVLKLAKKYLGEFGINPAQKIGNFDLVISNYAFTEIDRSFQEQYKTKYIEQSKKGYITCNWFGIRPDEGMKKEEIKELNPNGHFIPEIPLTGTNNCIYIWE